MNMYVRMYRASETLAMLLAKQGHMNHVYGEEVKLGDNFTLCFCMYIYS
jgi:hypothetical protein